jgi:hypothetical protein
MISLPACFSRSSQASFLEKCKNQPLRQKEKCMEKCEPRLIFLRICAIPRLCHFEQNVNIEKIKKNKGKTLDFFAWMLYNITGT